MNQNIALPIEVSHSKGNNRFVNRKCPKWLEAIWYSKLFSVRYFRVKPKLEAFRIKMSNLKSNKLFQRLILRLQSKTKKLISFHYHKGARVWSSQGMLRKAGENMKAEQLYKCGKLWEYSKHGNPISKLCRICRNPVNLNISSNLVQKNIFLTNLRHEFGRIFFNFLVEMRFLSELTSIKTVEKGSNNQEKAKISLVASHHLELILSCSESLSLFIFLSQKTLVYFKSDHPYQTSSFIL